MPSGDKRQHSEPLRSPQLHLHLLWITGLSGRHQDAHCRESRCLTSLPKLLFGFLISRVKEWRSDLSDLGAEAARVKDTDTHLSAESRRSVWPIQRHDSAAQKKEKRALLSAHIWLLQNTDFQSAGRIVYNSGGPWPTRIFPDREVKKTESGENK